MNNEQILSCKLDDNLNFTTTTNETANGWTGSIYSCWDYWQNYWYPLTILKEYPVYIQERAKDKGKQAFEIIKMFKDKKFIKLEKVENFIDMMDALIKIL